MRTAFAAGLLSLLLASPASPWENEVTHPGITDLARGRFSQFDSILRDSYGLPNGQGTLLAVQTHFDEAIDEDLFDGAGFGSRYTRNQSLLVFPPFRIAPDDVGILINHCDSPCQSDALARADVGHLLRAGVYAEDNPNIRASDHFHDPQRPHVPPGHEGDLPDDSRGLDNTSDTFLLGDAKEFFSLLVTLCCRGGGAFRLFGHSALDRALSLDGASLPLNRLERPNLNALPDAERYLYRAITAPSALEREHYMALHFLSVGAVLHLLEDMSSVAHVRNDFLADHVLPEAVPGTGPSLEGAGADFPVARTFSSRELDVSLPWEALHGVDPALAAAYLQTLPLVDPKASPVMTIEDFWGRSNQTPTQRGLAQLVNQRFFSRETIGAPDYPSPSRPLSCLDEDLGEAKAVGAGASRAWLASLPVRRRDSAKILDPQTRQNFFSSELVPHLAACRFLSEQRPGTIRSRASAPWEAHVIDESVQRDYLEILLPLAIDYAAKFMELYFEPRIAVTAKGPTQDSPPRQRLSIEILSRFPLTARADEVRVYYDDVEGGRSNLALDCGMAPSQVFTLEVPVPGEDPSNPSALSCTMPLALPDGAKAPQSRGNFTVTIRGQLGERGSVVSPADDWRSADFVTAMDHVFGWQIAFQRSSGSDEDGDGMLEDGEIATDVLVTGFDLDQASTADDATTTPTEVINVTAALRAQLGATLGADAARKVDFSYPSSEPRGGRLAFGGDATHPASPENVIDVDPNEYYVANGIRSGRFTSLTMAAGREAFENFGGGPAWNGDPAVEKIVYTGLGEDQRIVQLDPDGQAPPIVSSGTTSIAVSSAFGGRAVGARGDLTLGTDLLLVDVATGEATDRLDMETMAVESCASSSGCGSIQDRVEQQAQFSPDGERIVFVAVTGPDPSGLPIGGFFVADLATSGRPIRRLQGPTSPEDPIGQSPAWSPDGEWIAFLGQNGRISVIPSTGGRVIALPFGGNGLTWLPSLLLPSQ